MSPRTIRQSVYWNVVHGILIGMSLTFLLEGSPSFLIPLAIGILGAGWNCILIEGELK